MLRYRGMVDDTHKEQQQSVVKSSVTWNGLIWR